MNDIKPENYSNITNGSFIGHSVQCCLMHDHVSLIIRGTLFTGANSGVTIST